MRSGAWVDHGHGVSVVQVGYDARPHISPQWSFGPAAIQLSLMNVEDLTFIESTCQRAYPPLQPGASWIVRWPSEVGGDPVTGGVASDGRTSRAGAKERRRNFTGNLITDEMEVRRVSLPPSLPPSVSTPEKRLRGTAKWKLNQAKPALVIVS